MARSFQEVYQELIRAKISQVATWINSMEPTAITEVTEKFLVKAAEPELPLEEVKSLLNQAVFLSSRMEDSLEPAEVRVRGGVILIERGDLVAARELWEEAAQFYDANHHTFRHAVVCLLLGYLDLLDHDRAAALVRWRWARAGFGESLRSLEQDERRKLIDPLDGRIDWLKENLFELGVEEALLPEKVVEWLNLYDPVSLNGMMGPLVDRLYAAVAAGEAGKVGRAARLVQEIAPREGEVKPSALLMTHAGAALLMVGEIREARRFLRQGVEFSSRRSHQEAVTLWLKALAEWMDPERQKEAVTTSRLAIEAFTDLSQWADHRDLQARRGWYLTQRKALVEVTERLFRLFLPDLLG